MIIKPKMLSRLGGPIHFQEGDPPNKAILRGMLIRFDDQFVGSKGHSFTKDTDIEFRKSLKSKVVFNHRIEVIPKPLRSLFSNEIRSTSIWLSTLKLRSPMKSFIDPDSHALGVELVLDLHRSSNTFIADLAKEGILSFSTGALQRKVKVDRKTGWIKRWHITEISIVLTPIESKLGISKPKPVGDVRLLSLLFDIDLLEMIADHKDQLVQFMMVHED